MAHDCTAKKEISDLKQAVADNTAEIRLVKKETETYNSTIIEIKQELREFMKEVHKALQGLHDFTVSGAERLKSGDKDITTLFQKQAKLDERVVVLEKDNRQGHEDIKKEVRSVKDELVSRCAEKRQKLTDEMRPFSVHLTEAKTKRTTWFDIRIILLTILSLALGTWGLLEKFN